MKGKKIVLSCAIAALTISAGATANEIYKWTDDNGNVHYEDRPSGSATEERLQITYRRTDGGVVQQRIKARHDAQSERAEARSAAEEAEQKAAENAEIEEQRQQACEQARTRLETYLQARRLYRTDDNGERVYLDDDQRTEARQRAEDQIAELCS